MENVLVVEPQNQLTVIIEENGLEANTASAIKEAFLGFFEQAKEWKAKAEQIVVNDATQVTEMKKAREGRLAIRKIRIEADKRRKELKEESLRYGKAVQGVYNLIEYLIVPIEEHLEKQENFAVIAEANRKEALHNERVAALQPYNVEYTAYDLRNMSEDAFKQLLDGSRLAHENKLAEAARLEAEKIAAQKAEQERIEAQRLENERLKKEAEEREKVLAEERKKAEAEKKAIEEKARLEREETERLAKVEAAKQAEALRIEREEREKVEAELKAKQQAEADHKAAEEKARLTEQKAAKKAAAAPDKDKIAAIVMQLERLVYPEVKTDEAMQIVSDTKGLVAKVIAHIKTKTEQL
jgi:hypothetical protein